MLTNDQISVHAVFPTGPYGDLSDDAAREVKALLDGTRRQLLVFARDGSRPQLHVTAWFAHPRPLTRAAPAHHRSPLLEPVAA